MPDPSRFRSGMLFALIAYTGWGLIPVYFRELRAVDPVEILAHRIVWAVLLLAAVVPLAGHGGQLVAAVTSRRLLGTLLVSATLLSFNWLLYIYATVNRQVVDASLGYYMLPLVNAFLATVFLGERLRPAHYPALALIAVAVLVPSVVLGLVPWLSVGLAVSFGLYGLVRKTAAVESLTGLAVETLLMLPAAGGALAYFAATGGLRYGVDGRETLLLSCSGMVTVVPLLTFTLAIRRLPLLALTMVQVLSPTMQFVVAVYWFVEPVEPVMAVTLGCVWTAVGLFLGDAVWQARIRRPIGGDEPTVAEMGREPAAVSDIRE